MFPHIGTGPVGGSHRERVLVRKWQLERNIFRLVKIDSALGANSYSPAPISGIINYFSFLISCAKFAGKRIQFWQFSVIEFYPRESTWKPKWVPHRFASSHGKKSGEIFQLRNFVILFASLFAIIFFLFPHPLRFESVCIATNSDGALRSRNIRSRLRQLSREARAKRRNTVNSSGFEDDKTAKAQRDST